MTKTQLDPRVWLIENEDLWENAGDYIEFHCPLEQVPQDVLELAEAYKKRIERITQQDAILDSMGVPRVQIVPMPNLDEIDDD